MALGMAPRRGEQPLISRRALLAVAFAAATTRGTRADAQEPGRRPAQDDHDRDREQSLDHAAARVLARARAAELGPLAVSRSANYTAAGDAPESFRQNALATFEDVALDYLDYYRGQGFAVRRPGERMVVVTLADRRSFLRYLGVDLSDQVVGIYDRRRNELVIYDARARTEHRALPRPRFVNQVSLAHEATHQLAFNTGLLNPAGDVPGCIVEGLALFGEVRKTTGHTPPGMLNQDRLRDLAYTQRRGTAWIPLSTLLVDDRNTGAAPADSDDRRSLYYAQSWLLVYFLLKDATRRPGFQTYLSAIFGREDATQRLADAHAHLGDLDQLDRDLRRYSIRLLKGR